MKRLEDIQYLFPLKEIEDWHNGKIMSEQTLKSDVCFLRYNKEKDIIELSKNGTINYSFALKWFDSIKPHIDKLKNNSGFHLFKSKVSTRAFKQNDLILIKFKCIVVTLENVEFVLKQKENNEL